MENSQKVTLRQAYKHKLAQLPQRWVRTQSEAIAQNLTVYLDNAIKNHYAMTKTRAEPIKISLYIAMRGEPSLTSAIVAMQERLDLRLFFPAIQENIAHKAKNKEAKYCETFVQCNESSNFDKNSLNFWQPQNQIGSEPAHYNKGMAPDDCPDIMVIPCLAFDIQGHRLGRGKGFFDRMSEWCQQQKGHQMQIIICAFALQEHYPQLPTEPHDLCAHVIVTELGVVRTVGSLRQ